MPEPTFYFEQLVPAADVAQAVAAAALWVRDRGGAVVERRPPGYLRAHIGGRKFAKGWDVDAPKDIELYFTPAPGGVHIRAVVSPGFGYRGDAKARKELSRQSYALFLASLWGRYLVALETQTIHQPLLNPQWDKQLADARRRVEQGKAAMAIGIPLVALGYLVTLTGAVRFTPVVAAFVLAPAHLITLYGFYWYGAGQEQEQRALKGIAAGQGTQPVPTAGVARRP